MFKSIVCTYPNFPALPKGLKQMLLASENLFFSEIKGPPAKANGRETARKPLLALQKKIFTNRRELPPDQSRAFQWEYWSK